MKLFLVDDSVLNYDDDDIVSEMMDSYINPTSTIEHGDDGRKNNTTTIPPHEDPITETNSPENESMIKKADMLINTNAKRNEVHDPSERSKLICLSKCIKKWGICGMVVLILAITVTGTVVMFRRYNTIVQSSSSSSSEENNDGDISFAMPSTSPSISPSVSPTLVPTSDPSTSPSDFKDDKDDSATMPTKAPITVVPTAIPTSATPSNSPSTEQYSQIISVLREASTTPNQFNNFKTHESLAAQWVKYNSTIDLNTKEKIVQRYTMALLDLALHSKFTMALPSIDECEWLGVSCSSPSTTTTSGGDAESTTTTTNSGSTTAVLYKPVTSVIWNDQNMTSTQIPNDIVLLSNSLTHLDLSENRNIYGTIPYGLYSCTQLQLLYMYDTQMTGSIRTEIGQLSNLKKLFLGNSAFTGTIPIELGISSLGTFTLTH